MTKKNIKLSSKKRENKQKNQYIGWIPGVVYGPELEKNKLIWVDYQKFFETYDQAGGSTLVDLSIEGEKEEYPVLVHDVQYHPLSGRYYHLDFYAVKMGEAIETEVELNFEGEAPAVKEKGGILVKSLHQLQIKCLPKDLIGEVKVDLGLLKEIDDCLYVKDLKLPEEIEIQSDPDTAVISVAPPRSEEELEGLDEKVEADMDQVETVDKKEGEEEEEAEGKEAEPKQEGKEAAEETKK